MATGILSVTLESLKRQTNDFGLDKKIWVKRLKKNDKNYTMLYWTNNVLKRKQKTTIEKTGGRRLIGNSGKNKKTKKKTIEKRSLWASFVLVMFSPPELLDFLR